MLKVMLMMLAMVIGVAQAGIVISGTRFVYPSQEKNIAVQLNNVDGIPALVQSWLEQGDDGQSAKVPFIIMPPLTRVEPNSSQSLRIRYTGEPLPQDRESLFYLNILDIPAKPKGEQANENYLQFTFRSRLKFFYRPNKLPYAVDKAYEKVTWSLDGNKLTFNNPTPYHITYAGIELRQDEMVTHATSDIDMIAPFATQSITLTQAPKANQVQWYVISDHGGTQSGITNLQ